MSQPEGEPSRLSDAIDEILKSGPRSAAPPPPPPGESYVLPTIVPATVEVPVLPDVPTRTVTPVSAPAAVPPQTTAQPTAQSATQPAIAAPAPTAPAGVPATGWGDHVSASTTVGNQQLRATGRRPRVRRVTRVVRHIDPWSTFKLALVFNLVGYLVALTSGVLLWQVADRTGTLDNVERWFTQFGWETFELKGGEIFHNAWVIGLFAAIGLTGAAVLMATLFNLVSDIVGGIRVTVLEEEVVERTASSARRFVVRRPPLGTTSSSAWNVDDPTPSPETAATLATPTSTSTSTAASDWSVDD